MSFPLKGVHSVSQLKKYINQDVIVGHSVAFNGTLFPRKLIEKIGFPNKDFFIKGDETDYLNRAERVGAIKLTAFYSIYYHPSLNIPQKRIGKIQIPMLVEAPWKEYYRARNYCFQYKRNKMYKAIFLELFLMKIYAIFKSQSKHKVKCAFYVLIGIVDGLKGRLGKRFMPAI